MSEKAQITSTELDDLFRELHSLRVFYEIHRKDSREIEELYRTFLFPDLSRREDRFEDYAKLLGTSVGEAVYILHHLQRSLELEGDICEFGVAQGATSALLAKEILGTSKELWLFDSFEGLPKPSEKDRLIDDIFALGSIEKYEGTMKCRKEEVLERLTAIPFPSSRLHLLEGWIDETLQSSVLPHAVAFAYVDFDFYEPIRLALGFLDDRLSPGGCVVVDDYGFFSEGAQRAVDEFLSVAGSRYRFDLPVSAAGRFCILTKVCQ